MSFTEIAPDTGAVEDWLTARGFSLATPPASPDDVLRAAGPVAAGDAARAARDWPAAASHYARAVRENPSAFPIWVQYGHALSTMGELAGATEAYSRALALAPAEPDTLLHLGHVLGRQGDLASGMLLLAEAVRLAPGFALAAEDLARLHRQHFLEHATAAAAAFGRSEIVAGMRQLDVAIDPPGHPVSPEAEALRRARGGELDEAVAALLLLSGEEPADPSRRVALRAAAAWRSAVTREGLRLAPEARELPVSLHFVAFGTTGRCNASCLHCPTGKPETAHAPRIPMPMPLFERVVTEMAELGLWVRDQISLGLFGDGLVDPFVVQRAQFLRCTLPGCTVVVPTNGAAYNPARHLPLRGLVDAITLHVESIRPAVYDTLMAPLRAERVFPKHDSLLRDFPGQVHVTVPVSRMNEAELDTIREHFVARGAVGVDFAGLSNRCAAGSSAFDRLALAPQRIRCAPEQASANLVVDCDGEVLICCNDFSRVEPIGNLARDSLAAVLTTPARALAKAQFAAGRHDERATCRRCYGDIR